MRAIKHPQVSRLIAQPKGSALLILFWDRIMNWCHRTVQQPINWTDILMFRPKSAVAFRKLFEPKVSEHLFVFLYKLYVFMEQPVAQSERNIHGHCARSLPHCAGSMRVWYIKHFNGMCDLCHLVLTPLSLRSLAVVLHTRSLWLSQEHMSYFRQVQRKFSLALYFVPACP
jgi:hypothetical protein